MHSGGKIKIRLETCNTIGGDALVKKVAQCN